MKVFTCRSIAEAHECIIKHIAWDHVDVITEDNETCWYGKSITLEITNPLENRIHPKSPHQKRCEIYEDHLLNGTPGEFVYDYHDRLCISPVDQLSYIISKLTQPDYSRRAVAVTWRPDIDCKQPVVPCLQYIQFMRHNNILDMYVLFRSEDMIGGFGPNAYGLTGILKHLCNVLTLYPGKYEHIVTVPHIYYLRDEWEFKRFIW